ncbi:hypothetical protein BG015_003885 [Linnemannia schmuckeri]|uniref:F-box domain-containing protein n=1 Tax=Linnemannia schmuckeri TaxID=64567 RepID=A0A9P5VF27_9FUNG|nr:hypothetical protein BG015_003885 [Linnemannia schmuckeri]
MDALSRLPVKCLEHILRCISAMSAFQAGRALAALFRVNRHISRVTIPFLCNNLFKLTDDCFRSKASRLSRILIRTLVTKLPTSQVHPALFLGLDIDLNTKNNKTDANPCTMSSTSHRFNYHGRIRHLNIGISTFFKYNDAEIRKLYYPLELKYIHGEEFLDMYLKDRKDAICVEKRSQWCPEEIRLEIFRVLPSSYKPDYISPSNWDKVSTFLMTTDLRRVQSLHWVPRIPQLGSWFRPGVDRQSILQRCRSLSKLECSLPLHGLDALASAFSQSLKHLDVKSFLGSDLTLPVHIGHGWLDFPFLRILTVHASKHRLALDPLLLAQCPSLTEVKITDETYEYFCEDIVPCLPAKLPGLMKLYLKGWSALSFHPDTLESTKELTTLKLCTHRSEHCFIPPVTELNSCRGQSVEGEDEHRDGVGYQTAPTNVIARPQWTWFCDLPCLKYLALTSEFTCRFEFRMLQGCPALEYLRLYMRTTGREHGQVISERDLWLLSRSRIVAPKLRKLYMNGHWFIETPSALPQFLGQMFPKLERLVAKGWQNVAVESLVNVVRTEAQHIRVVRTDMEGPVTKDDKLELGMVPRSDVYMKTDEYMRNRFFCSGKEYCICLE